MYSGAFVSAEYSSGKSQALFVSFRFFFANFFFWFNATSSRSIYSSGNMAIGYIPALNVFTCRTKTKFVLNFASISVPLQTAYSKNSA